MAQDLLYEQLHSGQAVQAQDSVDPPVNPNSETSTAQQEEAQILSVVVAVATRSKTEYTVMQVEEVELLV